MLSTQARGNGQNVARIKQNLSERADSGSFVRPFDLQTLPALLNGTAGTNRGTDIRAQIAADNDLEAVRSWLARYDDTPTTYESYRKEAERLLLWSVIELRKPLSSLVHEDLVVYQQFLADPQPASRWIMTSGRKVSRDDDRWRPFVGPLAPSSRRQTIVILNTMFSWLVNAGYLSGNPLSLTRQRARKPQPRVTRYLDEELWMEIKKTIDLLPQETTRERAHYSRVRWLFSLLYLCGLRISEITNNTMGGFFCRRNSAGADRWWLEITGKGNKTRLIPATSELMVELNRYRRDLGFSAFPIEKEETPLLLPIGGNSRPLTRGAVHLIIKALFDKAATRLSDEGPEQSARAEHIRRASAHWMRHTAGSHMANGQLDLRFVRDNLGHSSLNTTSSYLHSEDDARHDSTEKKHRIDWSG